MGMKSKMLLTSLGEVRDDYVEDADTEGAAASVKRFSWVKWAAVAACVLVAVLIAVPALSGKAPEVESERTEPVPAEEPTQASTNESAYETIDGMPVIVSSSGLMDGFTDGGDPYTFEDFVRDYKELTANPIFADLFADENIQQNYVVCEVGTSNWTFGRDQYAALDAQGYPDHRYGVLSNRWVSVELQVYDDDSKNYPNNDTHGFDQAEELGVRNDFVVDGVTVQKYNTRDLYVAQGKTVLEEPIPNPDNDPEIDEINNRERIAYIRWEQVNVDGDWYVVYGTSEADVDAIAAALARIAG